MIEKKLEIAMWQSFQYRNKQKNTGMHTIQTLQEYEKT